MLLNDVYVVVQFFFGLNFISLCSKLIINITIPQNKGKYT